MGMYPYQSCMILRYDANPSARSIDVVMTIADESYSEVIPTWARIVRASNKSCAVAALDKSMCDMAKSLHCHCDWVGTSDAVASKQGRGWHKARITGVKNRFLGALMHLYENISVFMHDADVFLREYSVTSLDRYFRLIEESS